MFWCLVKVVIYHHNWQVMEFLGTVHLNTIEHADFEFIRTQIANYAIKPNPH